MNEIFSRTGAQTIVQNRMPQMPNTYSNTGMDPSEFLQFMQNPNDKQISMKNDSQYSVNTAKVKNKDDYARALRHQIEEKQILKKLQDSPNQNYYKVTGYHPSIVEQTLHVNKQMEIQQKLDQQYYIPLDFQQPMQQKIASQNQNINKREQDDQPKNVRGMFAREIYQTNEQAIIKDAQNQQLRQELLRQIDEKKTIKELERQKQEIEDIIYMDRMKQQQEELGLKMPDNDRRITSLRAQRQNDSQTQQSQQQTRIKGSAQPKAQLQQFAQLQPQTQEPKIPYFQAGEPKYSYTPIFIPSQVRDHPERDHPQIEELKLKLQQIVERQPQQVVNFAQSEVDYDIMKHHYNHQQVQFDRDMSSLKDQFTRSDMGRVNAEKELVYLQERAREKRIWDVLDYSADTYMPNLALEQREKGIFRTAKYAIGNLSEGERRQNILKDYYKLDRGSLALEPLHTQQNPQIKPQFDGQQLKTQTHMIQGKEDMPYIPNNQKQNPKKILLKQNISQADDIFGDKDLQNQIKSIQNHDRLVNTQTHQQIQGEQIKDSKQYNKMLEQNSLAFMKINGDRKTMTPLISDTNLKDNELLDHPQIKKQNSLGQAEVKITYEFPKLPNDNLKDDQSQHSSVYDFPMERKKTEDILDTPKKINAAPKMQFGWEVDIIDDTHSEVDPIDQKIGGMLDNIKTIVNKKKQPDDYYTFQTELRGQAIKDSRMKQQQIDKQKTIPYWKNINFDKKIEKDQPNSDANLKSLIHSDKDIKRDSVDNQITIPHNLEQQIIVQQSQSDNKAQLTNTFQPPQQQQTYLQKQQNNQQKQQQYELDPNNIDHIDRLDRLLMNFSV